MESMIKQRGGNPMPGQPLHTCYFIRTSRTEMPIFETNNDFHP